MKVWSAVETSSHPPSRQSFNSSQDLLEAREQERRNNIPSTIMESGDSIARYHTLVKTRKLPKKKKKKMRN